MPSRCRPARSGSATAIRMEADSAAGRLEARDGTASPGAPPTLPPLAVRARDLAIFYHLEGVGERRRFRRLCVTRRASRPSRERRASIGGFATPARPTASELLDRAVGAGAPRPTLDEDAAAREGEAEERLELERAATGERQRARLSPPCPRPRPARRHRAGDRRPAAGSTSTGGVDGRFDGRSTGGAGQATPKSAASPMIWVTHTVLRRPMTSTGPVRIDAVPSTWLAAGSERGGVRAR